MSSERELIKEKALGQMFTKEREEPQEPEPTSSLLILFPSQTFLGRNYLS